MLNSFELSDESDVIEGVKDVVHAYALGDVNIVVGI
jgi:hypothetical protein